ncbi:hypothetical protein [Pseudonocardia hydrocarbonoxydans]|uniref:Uncharacterized protein n=1 Tax=Pseudonocardia hydrocarbonoxydans TaxID=76726 RepID=A0A4Y3WGP6_9PSEU|nr:hypothetical protein [Pseudonocardia hydrocarbonoxydans]GEC18024.1 hypothetical protein PHY01_03070 [Pseudonocardia hydrocarbonoxydans]
MAHQPDPDGPLNPDAPDLDLDVPVPGSPAETTADPSGPDDAGDPDDDTPEPPD